MQMIRADDFFLKSVKLVPNMIRFNIFQSILATKKEEEEEKKDRFVDICKTENKQNKV